MPPAGGDCKDGRMDGENPRDSRALLERHVLEGGLQRENLIRCRRSLALRVTVFELELDPFLRAEGKDEKTRFVAGQTLIARAGNWRWIPPPPRFVRFAAHPIIRSRR